MIQRGQEPNKGKWTLPGGLVKVGETLVQAATRELEEECRVQARLQPGPNLFEYIQSEGERTLYHYVIADFVGEYLDGELHAGSDAADAAWITMEELNRLEVTPGLREFISKAQTRRQATLHPG